jgi:hypothetical protein
MELYTKFTIDRDYIRGNSIAGAFDRSLRKDAALVDFSIDEAGL